ncbi:class III lanthipeptide [Streptomyces sp. NBC_00536]|nr:class III lanthipeptide [Streptomyces sp. NBC_00536]WUC82540.1 class III lanthipeptide [Streptomyces sp. NBC_00536]
MNKILALQNLASDNGPQDGETHITTTVHIGSGISLGPQCTATIN